jgi:mRNA interferase MazF
MKQGEIWLIKLDPTVGAEINKSRPALIVNVDSLGKLPLKVIAPITDWKEQYSNYPWMVKITPTLKNCLKNISAVDCFQIRSVSVERFINIIGTVEPEIVANTQEAITKIIGTS